MEFTPGQGLLEGQEEGNRGNSLVLPPPPGNYNADGEVLGPDKSIVQVESRCIGAADLGVCLGLTLEGVPNDSQQFIIDDFILPMVRTTLSWGIGGCKFNAECDFLNGTQFPISAEDIRIGARYIRITRPWDNSLAPLSAFPTYRVNAGFGYNSAPKNSNPARLTKLVQIQNRDDSKIIQIPDFAISWTMMPVDNATIKIRMIGFGTSYGVTYDQPTGDSGGNVVTNNHYNIENAIPPFNGARFLEVSTESDAQAFAFVIFGLSFG